MGVGVAGMFQLRTSALMVCHYWEIMSSESSATTGRTDPVTHVLCLSTALLNLAHRPTVTSVHPVGNQHLVGKHSAMPSANSKRK